MGTSTGKRYACAGAAVAAMLLYAAWPAPTPGRAAAARQDNYFDFVRATPYAPPTTSYAPPAMPVPALPPAGATAAARQAPAASDGAVPATSPLPTALAEMERKVNALRRQGADEQEVYRLRVASVSADVAARLLEREQAEAAWQRRVQAYRADSVRLTARNEDTAAHRAAMLARLRAEHFAPNELAHLEASESPSGPLLKQD